MTSDFLIVGAGIIGLTVAWELRKRYPSAKIVILEKEKSVGMHASGRNSGVLHSGIYYGSDTLKAQVCSDGARQLIEFARDEGVNYRQCGKVLLATSEEQIPTLKKLLENASNNNIPAEQINSQQLREIEPYAAEGYGAIYCPTTAVIDNIAVVKRLKEKLEQKNVKFLFDTQVLEVTTKNSIKTSKSEIHFGFLFNCAGAYADRVANMFDLIKDKYSLVPFKGIYWKLSQSSNSKVNANIYPVPDTSVPFLGVHLTRTIDGNVYVGPTAIPAFGRENYGILRGVKPVEGISIVGRLAKMYIKNKDNFRKLVYTEMLKYNKDYFLKTAQALCPTLKQEELVKSIKVGIRPQLVNIKTNKLEMDYILEKKNNSLHVLNSISPAFTSSFAFARLIVDRYSNYNLHK